MAESACPASGSRGKVAAKVTGGVTGTRRSRRVAAVVMPSVLSESMSSEVRRVIALPEYAVRMVKERHAASGIVFAAPLARGRLGDERIGDPCSAVAFSFLVVTLALEGTSMVEEGVASAQDIDTAMGLDYHQPTGRLKTTDIIGVDARANIV